MALTQENVHYALNSGPGIMNKSNRVHARIQNFCQAGGGGGGGGGGRGPTARKQSGQCFFSHQLINLFYSLQSGSNGRDSKCVSRGGSGGPDPPGKSQVIWVSIGYKQLDPSGKKLDPPPWKMLDPLWNLEK